LPKKEAFFERVFLQPLIPAFRVLGLFLKSAKNKAGAITEKNVKQKLI